MVLEHPKKMLILLQELNKSVTYWYTAQAVRLKKSKTLDEAVNSLIFMMDNQVKKYPVEELKEIGKQMRERNKNVLEQIKNHKGYRDDAGKNSKLFNIEEKLFKMENGDAK